MISIGGNRMQRMLTKLFKKDKIGEDKFFSFLFVTPTFLLYAAFIIVPILYSIYYSMTKWDGVGAKKFIGLNNFKSLIENPDYWLTFTNSLQVIVLSLIIQIPLGLFFAYLVYNTRKGFKFFRSVIFLPVVIAPAAVGLMFLLFFNGELGPLNKLFSDLGLPFLERNWLSDSKTVLYAVMFPMIWQYIGFYFVIFLAGLQSIPEQIFESAKMDGASSIAVFFKLVVPILRDIIQVCIILCVTGSLKAFDHPYIMTWGGPGVRSSYLAVYMFRTAFTENLLGEGTAIAITILAFALVFTYLFNRFFTKEPIQY